MTYWLSYGGGVNSTALAVLHCVKAEKQASLFDSLAAPLFSREVG